MTPPVEPRRTQDRTPGTWYAHDITTEDNRPVWSSEVRVAVGPSTYITIALCRSGMYQRQDAEYIACAANNHDALIEALDACEAWMGYALGILGTGGLQPPATELAEGRHFVELARAVLKLAKGEES